MSEPLNLRPAEEVIDAMFAPYRQRIAELERENAELRKDAERLVFVYSGKHTESMALVEIELRLLNGDIPSIQEVRTAIDNAITSEKENERG